MAFNSVVHFKKTKCDASLLLLPPTCHGHVCKGGNHALTGANGCVVAGPVLAQGSGALGGEGGSSTEAGTALPALSTGG